MTTAYTLYRALTSCWRHQTFGFCCYLERFDTYIWQNSRAHYLKFFRWVQLLSARLSDGHVRVFSMRNSLFCPCTASMHILRRFWWHIDLFENFFLSFLRLWQRIDRHLSGHRLQSCSRYLQIDRKRSDLDHVLICHQSNCLNEQLPQSQSWVKI